MYLARKPYNQLTKLDKEIAREDLARKVLKYYFSPSWGRGYFQLLRELEDFYDKFPKAGRDKVTFVRFIRSLSIQELKVFFTADPDTLFQAILWLERNKNKAKQGGAFGEFYQRVLNAVSELQSDKWSKKMVKAVFRLVEEFKPQKGREERERPVTAGGKERNFYDYFALYLAKECHFARFRSYFLNSPGVRKNSSLYLFMISSTFVKYSTPPTYASLCQPLTLAGGVKNQPHAPV